jgi:hypothetical protein
LGRICGCVGFNHVRAGLHAARTSSTVIAFALASLVQANAVITGPVNSRRLSRVTAGAR